MLALISSMLNKVPILSFLISIRKGNFSRTLSTFISMPTRCVSHVEVHCTVMSCRGGAYRMSATADGSSSARARNVLAHRITLFLLICNVLGYENACGGGFVRLP